MKKSHFKVAFTATAALVVLGFAAPKAEAAGGERLINYAHALENTIVKLNVELREHYSHTSVYRHMLSDTARLQAEAEHIDQLSHDPHTSMIHLRTDIIEVDKYVHHLHDLVDAADRGRYGHVHGDTHHVHSLMEYMENLVHSMEAEVANIQRRQRDPHHGHSSHSNGHDDHHGGNQWNRNAQQNIRIDPRGLFNLFRSR